MQLQPYTIGLVSISFRSKSPLEILQAVKAAGLSCIEWGSDVHAPCGDTERLHEIATLQKEYGITCSSYGTYFFLGHNDTAELTDYVHAAKILGTNVIRLWCGKKSGADMSDDEREHLLSECRKAARIAEEHDVIFCMECHRSSYTDLPEYAVALMKAVDSPAFRTYWQPFQWLDTDGSLAVAEAVAPYAQHIHVFNWHGEGRFPLADGADDWKRYLAAFSTPRTLLLEFMPDDRIESLPVEVEALKAIIGE